MLTRLAEHPDCRGARPDQIPHRLMGCVRNPNGGQFAGAVQLRQPLRIEEPGGSARPSTRYVTVVVAQGTEERADTLATMRRWLWLLGLSAFAAAGLGAVAP